MIFWREWSRWHCLGRAIFRESQSKGIDQDGNLTFGIKEHIAFPEISPEKINFIFSFEITVVTTAKNKEEGEALFKILGFPDQKRILLSDNYQNNYLSWLQKHKLPNQKERPNSNPESFADVLNAAESTVS